MKEKIVKWVLTALIIGCVIYIGYVLTDVLIQIEGDTLQTIVLETIERN